MNATTTTSSVFFRNGQGRLALINGRPAFHGMTLKVFDQDCTIVSARPQGVGFRYTVLTPEGKAVELSAKDIAAFKATVTGGEAETMFQDLNDWTERVAAWDGLRVELGADGVSRAVSNGDVIVGEYGPHYHLFLESYVRDVLKLNRKAAGPETGFSPAEEAHAVATEMDGSPLNLEPSDQPTSEERAKADEAEHVARQAAPAKPKAAPAAPAAIVSFDGLDAKVVQAMAEYAGLDSLEARYEELVRKEHLTGDERQLLCRKLKESGYVGAREHAGRTFPVYKDDSAAVARTVPNAKTAGLKDRGDAVAVFLRAATNPAELHSCLEAAGFPELEAALSQYSHLSFGLLKMSMTNRLRKLVATGAVPAAAVHAR